MQDLCICDEVFNDSAAALRQIGMPANQITCISHMLCDEHILACLIPLSVPVPVCRSEAYHMLDKWKSNGDSMLDFEYEEFYANYKSWIKDYINPFCDGPF